MQEFAHIVKDRLHNQITKVQDVPHNLMLKTGLHNQTNYGGQLNRLGLLGEGSVVNLHTSLLDGRPIE